MKNDSANSNSCPSPNPNERDFRLRKTRIEFDSCSLIQLRCPSTFLSSNSKLLSTFVQSICMNDKKVEKSGIVMKESDSIDSCYVLFSSR